VVISYTISLGVAAGIGHAAHAVFPDAAHVARHAGSTMAVL